MSKQMGDRVPCLELKNVRKVFGEVTVALDHVNLSMYAGEIIGLVGANGAGKSTLMKIITGVKSMTEGEIYLDGTQIPKDNAMTFAREHGVSCAYQEMSLCSNLNVYENFLMLHAKRDRKNVREIRKLAEDTLEEIFPGHGINLKGNIEKATMAEKQMIEICRAASISGLKIMILDEPTSSLTSNRVKQLHAAIRRMVEKNVLVIYISHKLEEIIKIATRVVVMKSGNIELDDARIKGDSVDEIIQYLGGNIVSRTQQARESVQKKDKILSVEKLTTKSLKNISMDFYKGEIVGITGLSGEGQEELLDAIFLNRGKKGSGIIGNPSASFVSGDRKNKGVFPLWNIEDNIVASNIGSVSEKGVLSRENKETLAKQWYEKKSLFAHGS